MIVNVVSNFIVSCMKQDAYQGSYIDLNEPGSENRVTKKDRFFKKLL